MEGKPSRSQVEELVALKLGPDLSECTDLIEECENLAYECLSKAFKGGSPHASEIVHVHASLLARVIEDLQVARWAATRGYTLQACSVAASAIEAAHSIGFVGVDAARARRWLEHTSQTEKPWSVYDAVMGTVMFLNLTSDPAELQEVVRAEYGIHEKLCVPKHVNPIMERTRRWKLDDENAATLVLYPFHSATITKEGRLAMIAGARAASTAIWVFCRAHLTGDMAAETRIHGLEEKTRDLLNNLPRASAS